MINRDLLDELYECQKGSLAAAIYYFKEYLKCSSIDSSLAVPGDADNILMSIQKLYDSEYSKKL